MKRIAKLLTSVAFIRMILSALQPTVEARRSQIEESRRIKVAEDNARRNWEAWQQARAEAEHRQQAATRAEQQRVAWQEARDEALALQRARAATAQQRYAAAAAHNGARAAAEWLQVAADETRETATHWWQRLWALLVLADRVAGTAFDEVEHGVAGFQDSVVKSKQVKAVHQSLMQTWAQHGWGAARARRIARERRMQRLNALAVGAGVGALAWYFLDPEVGSQRRAQFRDRLMGFVGQGQANTGSAINDGFPTQPARDAAAPVAASSLAGASGQSRPTGAYAEMYRGGTMAGSGSLASGLTGGASVPAPEQESWPLGVRVLAGLAGSVLMVTGAGFRGAPGLGGRAVGAGLLARALINMPFSQLVRRGAGPRESTFVPTFSRAPDPGESETGRAAPVTAASAMDFSSQIDSSMIDASMIDASIDIINPAHSDLRTSNLGTLEHQTILGRGLDEREIPLEQWQAFFDEIGGEYGDRIVVVERTGGARIAELPLLGASVDLRPDGRDVRLLLGTNLGTHMDHLIENVRLLSVLPGRAGVRGFRLEAADGATTVSPLFE
jgi:hypothetical protein